MMHFIKPAAAFTLLIAAYMIYDLIDLLAK